MNNISLPVEIAAIGSYFPETIVDNERIAQNLDQRFTADQISKKTLIKHRRWSQKDQLALDLASEAFKKTLNQSGFPKTEIRRLILTTSFAGDQLIPHIANILQHRFELNCDCFQVNNACMGFLSSLDIAIRGVATNLGPTAVIAVEDISHFLAPSQPRTYAIFGDGAVATIIQPSSQSGVIASEYFNDGSVSSAVYISHRTKEHPILEFQVSNDEIKGHAVRGLTQSVERVLTKSGLTINDIDWLIPHQPNGLMLLEILDALKVPKEKTPFIFEQFGSLGCVSMPAGLDKLVQSGKIKKNQRLLFAGVGAGMATGAMIFQW